VFYRVEGFFLSGFAFDRRVKLTDEVQIHNLKSKDEQKDILTEDEVELLTSPFELATYKAAITEAMFKGTARNIKSEDSGSKNAEVG
jgi:hypothetical protein